MESDAVAEEGSQSNDIAITLLIDVIKDLGFNQTDLTC